MKRKICIVTKGGKKNKTWGISSAFAWHWLADRVQYWKLRLVWISSRICRSSSSSNRPSRLREIKQVFRYKNQLRYQWRLDVPGNERFGLFGAFRAQISQSCQFKFVQLFLHQQTGVQEERKKKKSKEKVGNEVIDSFREKTNKSNFQEHQPANGGDSLTILELAKALSVIKRLHKDFRQFLLVLCAFIL